MRTLVRGASIVDGTGAPGRRGDLLVDGDRIVALGGAVGDAGARVIEADGLVACPGFVDMHAHSDLALLRDPVHDCKVSQGVTTEVLGQDGLSYAPTTARTLPIVRERIAGWNGPADTLGDDGLSVADYLLLLEQGTATNAAYLIPHGVVRLAVTGDDDRPPTPAELQRMRSLVARGMRDGAVGLSLGLGYVPGMFAPTSELVALAEETARHGGYLSPHHRSYGHGALDAYAEMIEVAARAVCPLHLAHATMNFPENRGRAAELLALIDAAIAAGLDVTFDSYPYTPGATTLAAMLPGWAQADGADAVIGRLLDPDVRARIRHEVEVTGSDGSHGVPIDWTAIRIAGIRNPSLGDSVGATVAEAAARHGTSGFDEFVRLLVEDRLATSILQLVGDEENVRAMMRHPVHAGGSDGILIGERPHPRGWGTFARYLGRYARDEGVLPLEEAVRHLTSTPARRLGLTDRGVLRQGAIADLVLFDPVSVRDRATFDDPRRTPEGVPWVLIAGTAAVEEGTRTESRTGRVLRGPAWRRTRR